jgi:DNA polymerase III epsilon subunit family exonuclease
MRTPELALDTKLRDVVFVAFDTETTGIGPGCRVVEIAGVRFRGGEIEARFEALVDPEMDMDPEAIAVHQITDEMVRGQEKAPQALARFFDFAGDAVLVAHNAPFDASVIGLELTRARLPAPANALLDTLKIARRCYPGSSHSLDALIDLLGIAVPKERHRALADTEVLKDLVSKLVEAIGGDELPLRKLAEASGRAESIEEYLLAFPKLERPLEILAACCREGSKANLHLDAGGARPRQLIVQPRLCYDWKGTQILEAYVPDERVVRTFRLDKIVKAEKGASSGFLF